MLKCKTTVKMWTRSMIARVPPEIYKDSAYPFKDGETVEVEIVKGGLLFRKL